MASIAVDRLASIIWDYMLLHHPLKKCAAILVLGSLDLRVAEYAGDRLIQGYGSYLICSGGTGKLTRDRFDQPEADLFAEIAIKKGIPENKILIENRSTNTGENIRFTYNLLQAHQLDPRSLLLIQKPYMERRTYATFKQQWPGSAVDIIISSPPIAYDDYFNADQPKDHIINIMVGDLQRIREYPKLGYQIKQEIPTKVWRAYEKLVKLGYDQNLIPSA